MQVTKIRKQRGVVNIKEADKSGKEKRAGVQLSWGTAQLIEYLPYRNSSTS